jgi:hypothetical protein
VHVEVIETFEHPPEDPYADGDAGAGEVAADMAQQSMFASGHGSDGRPAVAGQPDEQGPTVSGVQEEFDQLPDTLRLTA